MRFILHNKETQLSWVGEFPASEIGIDCICSQLKVENTAQTQVTIEAVNFLNCEMDENIFQDKTFVLDELNFLSKQLLLLTQSEQDIFSKTAMLHDFSMREMIELTVNTHCRLIFSL